MAVEEAADLIAEQPPARPLEERDQEVDAIGRCELALDLRMGATLRIVALWFRTRASVPLSAGS